MSTLEPLVQPPEKPDDGSPKAEHRGGHDGEGDDDCEHVSEEHPQLYDVNLG
jgi:hypothetical protein